MEFCALQSDMVISMRTSVNIKLGKFLKVSQRYGPVGYSVFGTVCGDIWAHGVGAPNTTSCGPSGYNYVGINVNWTADGTNPERNPAPNGVDSSGFSTIGYRLLLMLTGLLCFKTVKAIITSDCEITLLGNGSPISAAGESRRKAGAIFRTWQGATLGSRDKCSVTGRSKRDAWPADRKSGAADSPFGAWDNEHCAKHDEKCRAVAARTARRKLHRRGTRRRRWQNRAGGTARYRRATDPSEPPSNGCGAGRRAPPCGLPAGKHTVLPRSTARSTNRIMIAIVCLLMGNGVDQQMKQEEGWSPHIAVRIGEAKHPGPSFDDPDASETETASDADYWNGQADDCEWYELHGECDEAHSNGDECEADDSEDHSDGAPESPSGPTATTR